MKHLPLWIVLASPSLTTPLQAQKPGGPTQPDIRADADPIRNPRNVYEILRASDQRLIADLSAYTQQNPKADDVEQAYLALFDKVLDLESYVSADPIARRYLAERAEGASRPIAAFIQVMALAGSGQHAQALASFQSLIQGFDRADQEEFALEVTDAFARAEIAAGEYRVAKQAYEAIQDRFGESPEIRGKVADTIHRLDAVGKPAPPLQAGDVDGKRFRLADYRGKYVLVDFWATYCAPCVADLPALKQAYETYRGRGFEIVAVSLDDTREDVLDFVKARKIPWRQIHNGTAGEDLVAAFRVSALPCSFLISPEGNVVRLDLHGKGLDAVLGTSLHAKP